MKLIEKDKVIAEIERQRRAYIEEPSKYKVLSRILSFLDTLEVKAVDLQKEIKNRIDSLSNLYCYLEDLFNGNEEEGIYPIPEKMKNELFEFAKYFFELGLKTQKGEQLWKMYYLDF